MYICTLTPSSPKFKTVTLFTNCASGPRGGSATEGADAAGLARLLLPVAVLLVDTLLLDAVLLEVAALMVDAALTVDAALLLDAVLLEVAALMVDAALLLVAALMVVEVFVFLLEADLDFFLGEGLLVPAVDAVAVPDRMAEAGEKNCGLAAIALTAGEEDDEGSGGGCDDGCGCR